MKKKIIIVEDDPFTKQFYDYLFNKTDYTVIQSEDGDEIIKQLSCNEVVLIILDINLKNTFLNGEKIDGISISRFLKQSAQFSNIPILLATAYQKKMGNRNYFEESLADDYIVKPITDFNSLLNKVDQLVRCLNGKG